MPASWWLERDSHSRHKPFQGSALLLSYPAVLVVTLTTENNSTSRRIVSRYRNCNRIALKDAYSILSQFTRGDTDHGMTII